MSPSFRSEIDSDLSDDGGVRYTDEVGGLMTCFIWSCGSWCGILLGCLEALLFAWVAHCCSCMRFVVSCDEFDKSRYSISGVLTETSAVVSIGEDSDWEVDVELFWFQFIFLTALSIRLVLRQKSSWCVPDIYVSPVGDGGHVIVTGGLWSLSGCCLCGSHIVLHHVVRHYCSEF